MENIIIIGSTGMVSNLALNNCLYRDAVNKVTIVYVNLKCYKLISVVIWCQTCRLTKNI